MPKFMRFKSKKIEISSELLLENKVTRKYFEQHLASKHVPEYVYFFHFLRKKKSNEFIFKNCIRDYAPHQININTIQVKNGERLAAENDWNNPEWGDIIDLCRVEALSILDRGYILNSWLESKYFRELAFLVNGTPAAAAKYLGLKSEKAKKKLGRIIVASAACESKRDVEKLIRELREENGIKDLVPQIKMRLEFKAFIYIP